MSKEACVHPYVIPAAVLDVGSLRLETTTQITVDESCPSNTMNILGPSHKVKRLMDSAAIHREVFAGDGICTSVKH